MVRNDLLAVFLSNRSAAADGGRHVPARRGIHTVLVPHRPAAQATMEALRSGLSFPAAQPLVIRRLTSFLAYLRDVAAPPGAQVLTLHADDTLSTESGSCPLDEGEAAVLRLLGQRRGRVVSREEIALTT